jgi:GAF domain-containing protein/HAMP domain-containing protein
MLKTKTSDHPLGLDGQIRHSPRQFKLATRLSILLFFITVSVLIAVTGFVTYRANAIIEERVNSELKDNAAVVENTLTTWLNLNGRAVTYLAAQPAIVSMDPDLQKPVLEAMAKAYPNYYLVQTTDINGINVARNDAEAPKDYSDRQWYLKAKSGAPLTFDAVVGRTTGKPALNVSAPIRDSSGSIVGIADASSLLNEITSAVGAARVGKSGYAFVVNENNRVVAHPVEQYITGNLLYDFTTYPPVKAMRQGTTQIYSFTDDNGVRWRSYITLLENGWGVIAQVPEAELLAPLRLFQVVTFIAIVIGIGLLLVLAGFIVRRTLKPIDDLTEIVQAISAGDLSRNAEITSQDEIGTLAKAFNGMTAQLRDLISNLETRVSERTVAFEEANKQTEKRVNELEIISAVSRTLTSESDIDRLLPLITTLVSDRFKVYHVGIFLIDESQLYAVLRAANSDGGKLMLANNHKLEVGQKGIVGYVAQTKEPRIALNVGEDAVFFNNPDLPDTRSEMALPLLVHGDIIGVLDLQSIEQNAFTPEDANTISILADQVAIAIENARLFSQSNKALEEMNLLFKETTRKEWASFSRQQSKLGYHKTMTGGKELDQVIESEEMQKTLQSGELTINSSTASSNNGHTQPSISIPIKLRGAVIGAMNVKSSISGHIWSQDEILMAEAAAERVALALENARLLKETQQRAANEKLVSEISARIGSSISMKNVFQTAVEELGRILPGSDIVIQIESNKE